MLPRCKLISIIFIAACLTASSPGIADTVDPRLRDTGKDVWPYALTEKSMGQRIAYWAEAFLGTPYDTDPLGRYVREEKIVVDDAVDCMYLTFRSVELALSRTPEEAIENALNLRFHGKGKLEGDRVTNYDDRFQYGEDMIDSGKWGKEITSEIGETMRIKGSRGRDEVVIFPKGGFLKIVGAQHAVPLQDGDIVFFIKAPEKRAVGEIVGHIGIVSIKEGIPYLIHAGGTKKNDSSEGGGKVVSVRLLEYIEKMRFVGVRVTRFQ
jgi:hypothetical protein